MWYYEDGQLYMDTDVVTGKGGNHTKRGVGYIQQQGSECDAGGRGLCVLCQILDEGMGRYRHSRCLRRSQFGGKIYLTSGSHGCINTPLDNMIKLYNRVKIGTPVVIY